MLASHKNENLLGQNLIRLSRVDSTNNYAANILKTSKAGSGTVIMADEQTNGRGQRGSSWQSEPGMNLHFSAIWLPKELQLQHQKHLNFAVGVSIVRFLAKKNIVAQIKWPNDILVNQKKISGVLIENSLKGTRVASAIIGIGLNVNQIDFNELNATSMQLENQQFYPIEEVLTGMLNELNQAIELLASHRFEELENLYFQHLFGFNTQLNFEDINGLFWGEITGVDPFGNLIVHSNGAARTFGVKEIKFLF
jgi:BirA family biotin operon repressor/biotin-[acetyl-CoA-carboxylase] ligase